MNNKQLLQKYVDTGVQLPEYQVRSLPENLKNTYIRKRLISAVEQDGYFEDYEFKLLTPEQQIQYAMKRAENGYYMPYDEFKLLTQEQMGQYTMKRVENGYYILDDQFILLTPEQQIQCVTKIAEKGFYISDDKFELLTPEQQKIFIDKGGKID